MATDARGEPLTGITRVTPSMLGRLGRLGAASGDPKALTADDRAAMRSAGILDDDGVDPTWAMIARTLDHAVVRMRLELLRPMGSTCAGWVSDEAFLLTVPGPVEAEGDVVILVPAVEFPARLAAFVRLGPRGRPAVSGGLGSERSVLDAALDAGVDPRSRLAAYPGMEPADVETWGTALSEVTSTLHLHWRVEIDWPATGDPAGGRSLEVLDGGPAGIFLILPLPEGPDDAIAILPVTPTAVWRGLTQLLPDDTELGRPPVAQ